MQPQEKVVEIAAARRRLLREYAKTFCINEVSCKRIEIELQSLVKNSEFEARARAELGYLHAIRRDYSEAKRNMDRSHLLTGGSDMSVAMAESLASLYCGKIKEAAALVASFELLADPDWLDDVSRLAVHAGMFQKAEQCVQKLRQLKPDSKGVLTDMMGEVPDTDILAGAAAVRRYGLTDQDIVDRVQVATDVVMAHVPEVPFIIYSYSASYEDGILYAFPLRLAEDKLIDLEWKISEALVENFDDPLSEVIAFSVVPSEIVMREH